MHGFWKARLPLAAIACGSLLLLPGCGKPPQIATYTVEKDVPDRMLAAILVQEDAFWFFKLTGPREELAQKKDAFEGFLKSVELTDEGPKWELPDGWEVDDKPIQGRFATIKVPLKSKPAELTVSVLGQPQQSTREQFLAANINRWRGQMGQANLSLRDLNTMTQVDTRSGPAYVVNISGKLQGGGMAPPFAGRGAM
jgi:hypothetical protein